MGALCEVDILSSLLLEQAMLWADTKRKQGASIEQIVDALCETLLEIMPNNEPEREDAILSDIYTKIGAQLGKGKQITLREPSKPMTELEYLLSKVPSALLEENENTYFLVAAAGNYEAADWIYLFYFVELDHAKQMYSLLTSRYGCVRLHEWGSRINQKGNYEECWLSYWWSDPKYVGEDPSGRGWGIPLGNKHPVEYTPSRRSSE